jgi:hypothetical protein
MKPLTGAYVRAANEAYAHIDISAPRSEELPIELGQLRSAIEAVCNQVAFDADPSDFRRELQALAEKGQS